MNIEHIIPAKQVQAWAESSLLDPLALSFSRLVAARIDWNKALFKTLAKSGLHDDVLLNFQSGGKVSSEPRPENWLIDSLNAVQDKGNSFFLVEDWSSRPADAFITTASMPAVFNGDEVYYVVKDDPRSAANWGRICSNTVPLFHGFLIQGEPMPLLGGAVDVKKLEAFANCVQLIFFGIYDGESYLLCSFEEKNFVSVGCVPRTD